MRRVEAINHHLIESQIGCEGEVIIRRREDAVRVRRFLPFLVNARAFVLNECRGFAQAAVLIHGHGGHASAVIVGNQNVLAGMIHAHMAGPGPARRNLVQKFQLAGFQIDRECTHGSGFLAFKIIYLDRRVEKFSIRMNGEERRAGSLGRKPERCQLPRRGVEAERVNALAALAGIRADIRDVLVFGGFVGGARYQTQQRQNDGRGYAKDMDGSFHWFYQNATGRGMQLENLPLPYGFSALRFA